MSQDVPSVRRVTSREGYARWASFYDEFENPMTAMVSHVLAASSGDFDGARVLEIGCGTGRNMERLFNRGIRSYTGVDDSPEMLAIAHARGAKFGSVQLEERDLCRDWWEGLEGYDLVLVSLVLEHFEHVSTVLSDTARVARLGASLWILELYPERFHAGARAHVSTGDETLVLPSHTHDAEELCAAMQMAGWSPGRTNSWCPTEAQVQEHRKLARYRDRPVLLEVWGHLANGLREI
jgi:SAM-dependent methyltransferase